jgi:hypothetical protein
MTKDCSNIGIPEHLHQGEREEDSVFSDDEKIYRRFFVSPPKSAWLNNKQLSAKVFKLEDDSYNRERYSNAPEDVLFNKDAANKIDHYFSFGILCLICEDIKTYSYEAEVNSNNIKITFDIFHKPEKCIYPHSEIHAYSNGEYIKKVAPKSFRTLIRDILIGFSEIVKDPE